MVSATRAVLSVLLIITAIFSIVGIVTNQFENTPQYYQGLIYLALAFSIVFTPLVVSSRRWTLLGAGTTGAIHLIPPAVAFSLDLLPVSAPALLHVFFSIVLLVVAFRAYLTSR